jgi:CBS domain-containing protein
MKDQEKAIHLRRKVTDQERAFFLGELRAARLAAQRNAEDFHDLLFVFERLGTFLTAGTGGSLGDYKEPFVEFVNEHSALAAAIGREGTDVQLPFRSLYFLVNRGRNDALHQGAFARHLTTHAIELALVLEDALMDGAQLVRDFMVNDPVCASLWQPVSFVRQKMLENAFSYLPVYDDREEERRWKLISDRALAIWLQGNRDVRKSRLATTLEDALNQGLKLEEAHRVKSADRIQTAITDGVDNGRPALVVSAEDEARLIGIVTPFDVL